MHLSLGALCGEEGVRSTVGLRGSFELSAVGAGDRP